MADQQSPDAECQTGMPTVRSDRTGKGSAISTDKQTGNSRCSGQEPTECRPHITDNNSRTLQHPAVGQQRQSDSQVQLCLLIHCSYQLVGCSPAVA